MTDNIERLNNRINELTEIIRDLSIEVRNLRRENRENQFNNNQLPLEEEEEGQQGFFRGQRVRILNTYRGQRGRIVTVTRVHGERVYFTIDNRPSYRIRQNLEPAE